MVYVVVYILIENFAEELQRFQFHLFRKYGRTKNLGVEFLFRPLTTNQYIHLEYKFHDCIISGRLQNRRLGWIYRVST